MSYATLNPEWDVYLSALREDAHRLLAWGYADARARFPSARDEYDLTGFLSEAIDSRIDHPETPERFAHYSVHNERPVSPRGETGKQRPKLDIQIERCGVRPRWRYTFEAKRLRDDAGSSASHSLSEYLGDDG